MRVFFVAVEMDPLAKVGGLADVVGSLPAELVRLGHDARVFLPFHGVIDRERLDLQKVVGPIAGPWPWESEQISVWTAPVSGVPVYLIENERFFDRPSVYELDDSERWSFFTGAVLTTGSILALSPDLLHIHDWHPGLLTTRLKALSDHPWSECPVIFTIHNLAFHGDFDDGTLNRWGLEESAGCSKVDVERQMLLSGMAQGILHADIVSTVSKTYAAEILTPEFGVGLDPLLRARSDRLRAVLNGIDTTKFDPVTDQHIVTRFDVDHLEDRTANKLMLQERAELPVNANIPVAAVVTRLYYQKGTDILAFAFDDLLRDRDMQLIVLGTGDAAHEKLLWELRERYPTKVATMFRFDPDLAQQVYSGCDLFLMPSRYEPCGLGQMIAMRYGAVPVVRRTGGLADTVVDCAQSPSTGTGFLFPSATAHDLVHAVERALATYENKARWHGIQERGMRKDFSWRQRAGEYVDLYDEATKIRRRS